MKNLEVAKLFEQAADVLALLEENTFKILAYRKIARVLEELPSDIEKLAAAGELEKVAGIGKSSAERILEYLRTGKIGDFIDILAQVPAGVLAMTKIPSLGPKTAVLIWREGGVTTIEELTTKIADGSLVNLKGLGAKKLQKIQENLAHVGASAGRIRIGEALPIALELVEFLRALPGVLEAQYCGSLRRGRETIGDIDIAVSAEAAVALSVGQAVTKHPFCASVIQLGESKTSIRTGNGVQVDVRVVPPDSYGAALQYFTGSQAHNVKLRERAIKMGLKLSEWGLFRRGNADAALAEALRKLPVSLPSGNSEGDRLHSQFKKEILTILGAGFERYMSEISWATLDDLTEEQIKALESIIVEEYAPPFNSGKCMDNSQAGRVISSGGLDELPHKIATQLAWTPCNSEPARRAIVRKIASGHRGLYFFRSKSCEGKISPFAYIGIAAVGKKGSSDLRYRIDDHFRDMSGADNFVNKFADTFRAEALSGMFEWIGGATEQEIYDALGLAWIPPEMREDRGEIDAAIAQKKAPSTPFDLIEISDIRGDLHMHTTASDGSNSIEELVAEAKRRGYQYIAVTDHSKSQFQANGLKTDRLLEHAKAIRAVAAQAEKSGILVLAGTECDILADGSLDYEDDILAQLDWVVASPHAALSQDSEAATTRLVRATANPHVHVIGHPTGRIVPSRRGLEPDMAKVIFAAARSGVALEINANYHRLDLRDVHVKMAVDAGVPICIDTDAHSFSDFNQLQYGILTARRGWAKKSDILNARPLAEFKRWLHARKDQSNW